MYFSNINTIYIYCNKSSNRLTYCLNTLFTEGLGIIAPVLKDRPSWQNLLGMGLIGGAPAVAGAWIGGLSYSAVLAVLFLAVGAGAVFEVVYEIAKLLQKDTDKRPMPVTVFAGVTAGMLLLYVTGVLIK